MPDACQHLNRVTHCVDCAHVLPTERSTNEIVLANLHALKAQGAKIDTLLEAMRSLPGAQVLAEAVAVISTTGGAGDDHALIDAHEASKIVGYSPDWCRKNFREIGGRLMGPDGTGKRPRKMFSRSAVIAYANGEKVEAASVKQPEPSGPPPWSGRLIEIKGKVPG